MTMPSVSLPSNPPGALPRRISHVVLGGIALVILSATFFSGRKQNGIEPALNRPTAGPSQGQLDTFRKALEKKRLEAEEARERLARVKEKEAVPIQQAPQPVARGNSDPDRNREKAERAALASNVVLRVQEPTNEELDRASQIVVEAKKESPKEKEGEEEEAEPIESGKLLPAREGNLYRLYEGTTVRAALANTLEGSFTGPVTCVVTQAVFAQDGSTLLIAKGSRFLGEARRVEAQNQSRLAVSFKRLLMPNGYSVDLDSALGLDAKGGPGLKDKVDNHRLRTFGISGAVGLISGLSQLAFGGRSNVFINPTGSAATSTLTHYLNAVPTITIRAGHQVLIYLPKDLLLRRYEEKNEGGRSK